MKRVSLFVLVFALVVGAVSAVLFPHTLMMLEGDSFFQLNLPYLRSVFNSVTFANEWLSAFFLQYFRVPFIGGAIIGCLMALLGLLALMVASAGGRLHNAVWVVLPMAVSCAFFPFNISMLIETICFFLLLWVVLNISRRWTRVIVGALGLLLLMPWVSFPLLVLLLVVLVLLECFFFKQKSTLLVYLLPAVIIMVFPSLWSNYASFVPFEMRYSTLTSLSNSWLTLGWVATLSATLLLVFLLPKFKTFYNWHNILLFFVFVGISLFFNLNNEKLRYNEQTYRYVYLADEAQWNDLLSEIHEVGVGDDVIRMRFCLLAESALGTLPEHLFLYLINTPDDFHFRYDRSIFGCLFNRLFYQTCGIPDEAMHHAYEYANQKKSGFCFSCLRRMVDYALQSNDLPIARKYLAILKESTFHSDFVESRNSQLLQKASHPSKDVVEMRKDNFVGCYPFNSEMVRLAEQFPQNRMYLDYLLCGLLLQKDLQKFRIILEGFPYYHDKPLPKAYAEANALLLAQAGVQDSMFQMPQDISSSLSSFYQAYKANDPNVSGQYGDTYWYYYFYAQNRQEENSPVVSGH